MIHEQIQMGMEDRCRKCTRVTAEDALAISSALKKMPCYELYQCAPDCKFTRNHQECGMKKALNILDGKVGIKTFER